ncbi:MAG TPA: DNA repair protein RecN [Oceanithermus profundus]|uniref:DNA repair protein RecN n=1 Tax=Oceanithermus profundus TaxID=187137 RepID=A0A7C4V7F9_9DEIN|nr:DNA repair protein RecN [Oceanithermus profundus]
MLERLEVTNLVTLPAAELEPAKGLTVLTGETGTGKSILVSALGLLLGAKADPGWVRPGAEALLVTAWVDGASYSRRVSAGRSVPRIEGEVVTLAELSAALAPRVAVHTQHAALALSRRRQHREVLDRTLAAEVREGYREAYRRWRELEEELARLRAQVAERERRLDVLRFQLGEIEQLRPQPGELAELEAEAGRLGHVDEVQRHLGAVLDLLVESEENARDRIALAARELAAAARLVPELEPLARDLEAVEAGLAAVTREAEAYAAGLEADPERLEAVQRRIADLQRLERKYGGDLEAVLAFAEELRREIAMLEGAEDRLIELEQERARARAALDEAARRLGRARREAAERLGPKVESELRALGMPEARFTVTVSPLEEPEPHGQDEVRFLFAAAPELDPAPVEKAASGGELSRIMLALALHTGADAPTVVFDEIDVGIGGEVALAVAERLARLAADRQVLVVTHLPQIAAAAERHYRVVREGEAARLELLEGEARVRELARMLSGSYSDTALEHARELLAR